MKKIFSLVIVALVSVATYGQNNEIVTIQGTLSEVVNNEKVALPFANIFIEGSSVVTSSDMDGTYRIEADSQEGVLRVSFRGYEPFEYQIKETDSPVIELDIVLRSVSTASNKLAVKNNI